MEVKVLGTGCVKCQSLEKLVAEAIAETGIDVQLEKVSDIKQIVSYGVMSTPALVINGQVKTTGKVPSKDRIKELLLSEKNK